MGNLMEMQYIPDRIGEYLLPHAEQFLFDELSENYLKKAGIADILTDVPVPIRKTAMNNLSTLVIAQNMAFIIGCDLNFKYRDNYVAYIQRTFTKDFAKFLVSDGVDGAEKRDYDYACICFRAALLIDPDNVDAMYCYGRACKDAYEVGEGEEFIGRFKAESLDAFEKVTLKKPDFDMGYYFLGYGYLNLGLYVKAKLTWDTFMELSNNEEQKEEIQGWLTKLEEPVKIEEGYNHVMSGRFAEGLAVLEPYAEDERFNTWWPLWFYLGSAHLAMGDMGRAETEFLQVLQLSPSNLEAMDELVKIYKEKGDSVKVEKYEKKMEVVKHNMELDQAEKAGSLS